MKGKTYRCKDCNQLFADIAEFTQDYRDQHNIPFNRGRLSFELLYVCENEVGTINEQLRDHLIENSGYIHADHEIGHIVTCLNFAITSEVGDNNWYME